MMRRALVRSVAPGGLRLVRHHTDAKSIRAPNPFDQVLNTQNEAYVEELMKQYEKDPALVDPSCISVLEAIKSNPVGKPVVPIFHRPTSAKNLTEKERLDNMRLSWMIQSYEKNGHYFANVNPIKNLDVASHVAKDSSALEPSAFGFTQDDLQQVFNVKFGCDFKDACVSGPQARRLEDIVSQLRQMYCGSIGFELTSSGYCDYRNWFRQEIVNSLEPLPPNERVAIFDDVVRACGFEDFLHRKYSTQQRFGLDGGESLIPAMRAAIIEACEHGATSCILGMAHRGRLNILSNILQKTNVDILSEFEGKIPKGQKSGLGDVKYHMGHRKRIQLQNGVFDLELLPNPSHLEAVNPVVLGKARARQEYQNDADGTSTLPILIHGDAAAMGQGSCYEIMGFCELESYNVGGTLHIIVNNQIGFTANPWESRSSTYCSDLANVNNAPVLHVNGDDVEACVRAFRIAARFRQKFHRDVFIDLTCYRRNGHNETDLPEFTQPSLYKAIRSHPTLVDIYSKQLVKEGVLTNETVQNKKKEYDGQLRQALDTAHSSQDNVNIKPSFQLESENQAEALGSIGKEAEYPMQLETGVDIDVLRKIGMHITTIPSVVKKAHPVVLRTYAARKKAIESGEGIEWCLGELLAFGSMSLEGISVRLSGEDVERGTFTQRHATATDQETNLKYTPVANISCDQAQVTICNSSLSELGVCGFDLGYNMEKPSNLCMWEAQFGDFANGAQVIIDQFLSSSEEKWNVNSSLVLSLPHGYSGAGPEHSSARIERFLQLCNDTDRVPNDFRKSAPARMLESRIRKFNWQVCYPSTPASYFHMLRRQVVRDFAKPLVFFFSKARLRAPNVSSLEEMSKDTIFQPVIDTGVEDNIKARKVLFCSGQIESIVHDHRKKMQADTPGIYNDVVLVKVEQISPFPWEQVADVLEKYHSGNPQVEFAWLQEEPKNMGPWAYVRPRLQSLMHRIGIAPDGYRMKYIGRPSAASPSTGYTTVHIEEEKEIIDQALA